MSKYLSVILFVVLLVLFFLVAVSQTGRATQAANLGATGLLALIAATAIGIERVIEGVWTVIGQFTNAWWPLNEMAVQVKKLEDDMNQSLEAVYAGVEGAVGATGNAGEWVEAELAQLPNLLADMRQRISDLQTLASGNQRVNLVAATALQNIAILEKKYPALQSQVGIANQAIAGLTDFVASFRDNPARRMISLFASAILGLLVAWIMGLDVFLAVFGSAPQVASLPYIGVALTGLLIGLGSGPTHDVVSVLQEVKKLRAAQNQPGPSTVEGVPSTTVESGDSRGLVAAGQGPSGIRRFR